MKILIAPDSFKGTVSATGVINELKAVCDEYDQVTEVDGQPLSDGGEGFVEACCGDECQRISIPVTGPTGKQVIAAYGLRSSDAYIEIASSSGIELLTPDQLDPLHATTFGLGELIRDAISHGARRLFVGLGGSATHDAGMGMLRALGVRFLSGIKDISQFSDAHNISSIDFTEVVQLINNVEVICAADVTNPLLGENGAARIYARQKGASDDDISKLEKRTGVFAEAVENACGGTYRNVPGAGAAGGTGFALFTCLGARMQSGFEVMAEAVNLEERVRKADVIITGEGFFDRQSSFGKAPFRMCELARKYGKSVYGIFGGTDGGDHGFDRIISLTELSGSKELSMARSTNYIRQAGHELMTSLQFKS